MKTRRKKILPLLLKRVNHYVKQISQHIKKITKSHFWKTRRKWMPLTVIALFAVVIIFASFNISPKNTKRSKGPLNVILLSIDSLRPDHMSLYGYSRNTTPRIDAWAKDAVVFKNHFSTSFLTPISEVSLQTGKYPFTTGVVNFESYLSTSTPTLGEILKQNGWQTAAFGSSAEFSGYNAGYSLARSFDIYDIAKAGSDVFNGRGGNPFVRSLPWIKQAVANKKPFFLWIPIGSVHWPYGQSETNHFSSSTYDGYLKNISYDTWHYLDYIYQNKIWGRYKIGAPLEEVSHLDQHDFDYLVGRYDDGIVMTDRRLGQLLAYLKDSGLDKNTVVILESEHGEGLNERGYIMHYDIYDEQVHTPLIIKAPMLKPAQISALSSGVDVLPTLLSILGLPPTETDGKDLLPYLTGKADAPRDEVYLTSTSLWERVMSSMNYEHLNGFYDLDNSEHFADTAIRTKEWKLIHRRTYTIMPRWSWLNFLTSGKLSFPEYELYDLTNDPGEQHNIFDKEQTNPSVIYLEEHLADWESKQFKTPLPRTTDQEVQPYF